MQGLWTWLSSNSAPLQAVGSIGAVLVAIALGYVAYRQAHAADAQAKAAEIQAKAARAQVEAANRQIESSFIISDIQTSPTISIGCATRNGVIMKNAIAFTNNGNGAATKLQLFYRDSAVDNEMPLNSNILAVGESHTETLVNLSRITGSGLTLVYQTAFGTKYAVDFEWDVNSYRAMNLRRSILSRDFPGLIPQSKS